MKKCQDCRANKNNSYCELGYKTEDLTQIILGYAYNYISPLEKCYKPKNRKEYILKIIEKQKKDTEQI